MTQETCGKYNRRRCCECRLWYVPAPSAATTQKTCSQKCRLRRRAGQERKRRAADLANARADERERQRSHRSRQQTGAEEGAVAPPSLTGLRAQALDAVEEIVETVGQAQRLSLTGLRRGLRRKALKTLAKMAVGGGHVGQDRGSSLTGLSA